MEYLCFGPRESIPLRLRRRKTYMHNPYNANVKVSRREMAEVGKVMATRLNVTRGSTAVLVPLRGWSIYGGEAGPLHDHRGNRIFIEALKGHLKTDIRYEEIDAHINDHQFADACVNVLLEFMEGVNR
jgi:uncharacterized protein (UPF0261 family)